ncbi:integral membrane protein [Cryptococcus neoformans]|nr:integral membrane protein [Cryptococcus neoformans var. grubii]
MKSSVILILCTLVRLLVFGLPTSSRTNWLLSLPSILATASSSASPSSSTHPTDLSVPSPSCTPSSSCLSSWRLRTTTSLTLLEVSLSQFWRIGLTGWY